MIKGAAIATGLAFAIVAGGIASHGTAGGEGWATPYAFSPVLLFAYPLVLLRLTEAEDRALIGLDVLLLATAAAADLLLVRACVDDAASRGGLLAAAMWPLPWPVLWGAIWLFWQILTVAAVANPALAARLARRFIDRRARDHGE